MYKSLRVSNVVGEVGKTNGYSLVKNTHSIQKETDRKNG